MDCCGRMRRQGFFRSLNEGAHLPAREYVERASPAGASFRQQKGAHPVNGRWPSEAIYPAQAGAGGGARQKEKTTPRSTPGHTYVLKNRPVGRVGCFFYEINVCFRICSVACFFFVYPSCQVVQGVDFFLQFLLLSCFCLGCTNLKGKTKTKRKSIAPPCLPMGRYLFLFSLLIVRGGHSN